MKDKNPRNMDLGDVLAEIQIFLDNTEAPVKMSAEEINSLPSSLKMSDTNRSHLPHSWTMAQYYLTRQSRQGDADLIEHLPSDLFIVC